MRFITGYIEAHDGASPTFEEMRKGCGMSGRRLLHARIEALVERGAIKRTVGKARAIRVVQPLAIPRSPEGAPLYFVPVDDLTRTVKTPASGGAETGGIGHTMNTDSPEGTRGATPALLFCMTATAPVQSPSTGHHS
ncbi:LexA family protein [Sphingobium sp. DEHP117]|uniref:LexA family protein n=1 Tax=Sphingobium sp. DEHP117 TaxID=2993436 RepID=UPI0035A11D85